MTLMRTLVTVCTVVLAGCASGGTGSTTMSGMDSNMKHMQGQMEQMHATPDPKERQRLMREHMATMHERMMMMQKMMEQNDSGAFEPLEPHTH